LADLGIDVRIILKSALNKQDVDCTQLTQDTDQWQAVVNTVSNPRVS
jgi:hypothetical protein